MLHFVLEFKNQVDDAISRESWKERALWQTAVRLESRRVLCALHALSKTKLCASNKHVVLDGILGFALLNVENLEFVD